MIKKLIINLLLLLLSNPSIAFAQGNSTDSLQQYLQIQEYTKAISWLKKADPGGYNKEYLLNLGYCYYMNGDSKHALAVYQKLHEKEPDNLQANLYPGIIYQKMRKYGYALPFYQKLTLVQPDQYKYWLYAASMFSALEMNDSAFAYTEKAYQLNPRAPDAVLRYSSRLILQKQRDNAIAVINNFLKTDSTNAEVIARKINYSARNAQYKEVIFWGERLLKDSATEPLAYTDLAYAYLNTKQIDKCLAFCEWMEVNNMKNESLTYCAAQCHAQKKNYVTSNLLLDECLQQNLISTAVIYFRSKADNYEATKEYKKAIAQYDSSYYIFNHPTDLYYKARIYDIYLKNKIQASVFYKKYIAEKQKPEDPAEEQLFKYIREYIKP
ncbi:tetratricopeptide repeat protein [Niabella aquatica]